MKLLIITQKYEINNSVLGVFNDWWDKLAGKIDRIYILALEKKSNPILPNIDVYSMGKERGIGFFGKVFGFYAGLFKTIGKTDAIFIHMIPKYAILAAPVALFYRKPIFMWYTGVSVHWKLRLAVLFCKKVFTAHEAAMRINTPKRIITGHGIDVSKFRISDFGFRISDKITILSVGRITPSKGHDFVINAVADTIKSGYNLKLKIIGGVVQKYHLEYFAKLRKLVDDLKMESRIEFLGDVAYNSMPRHFEEARILINAVPFGGLDKVVLEAMASGVVPLTSNDAFLSVFPKETATQLVFEERNLEDLKNKLKNALDKKLYLDGTLIGQLRDIVIKNHNLDNLIDRIVKEMS